MTRDDFSRWSEQEDVYLSRAGTYLIQENKPELSFVLTTDTDRIIDAGLAGLVVERVPAPVETCGCPSCVRATVNES